MQAKHTKKNRTVNDDLSNQNWQIPQIKVWSFAIQLHNNQLKKKQHSLKWRLCLIQMMTYLKVACYWCVDSNKYEGLNANRYLNGCWIKSIAFIVLMSFNCALLNGYSNELRFLRINIYYLLALWVFVAWCVYVLLLSIPCAYAVDRR